LDYLISYYSSTYFTDFPERFGLVAYEHFQLREGHLGKIVALMLTLLLVLPAIVKGRAFWRNLLHDWRKEQKIYVNIFLLITFCCFLFLPDELPGQSPISQRFSIFFWLVFVIFVSLNLPHFRTKSMILYTVGAVSLYSVL